MGLEDDTLICFSWHSGYSIAACHFFGEVVGSDLGHGFLELESYSCVGMSYSLFIQVRTWC